MAQFPLRIRGQTMTWSFSGADAGSDDRGSGVADGVGLGDGEGLATGEDTGGDDTVEPAAGSATGRLSRCEMKMPVPAPSSTALTTTVTVTPTRCAIDALVGWQASSTGD
jgi:hypothetical protein